MKTIEELKRLNELITNNKIGKAKYLWGGADVAVVKEQPKKNSNSFYPDTFFVVSEKFSFEISWMFEQLKAVFMPTIWLIIIERMNFSNDLLVQLTGVFLETLKTVTVYVWKS